MFLFLTPQAVGIQTLGGQCLQGGNDGGLVCGIGDAVPLIVGAQHLDGGLVFFQKLTHGQGEEILCLNGVAGDCVPEEIREQMEKDEQENTAGEESGKIAELPALPGRNEQK